jgi:maltokinase
MTDVAAALRNIDEERLGEWISKQRWFASKSAEMSHFGVLDVVSLSETMALAIVEARFHAGTHDLYQMLVGIRETPAPEIADGIHDILAEPEEVAVLVGLMRAGAEVEGAEGTISFHWTGDVPPPSDDPKVRPLGVEQSNTSVVIDDRLILKVFRRLEPGVNPELEMLRFLTAKGFGHIAPLAGWYEVSGQRLGSTLGVLQTFVAGAREGWAYATEDPDGFLDEVGRLGEVTGRMHTTLASDMSDPAFAPEEPGLEALSLLVAQIDEEIERTFVDLDEDDPRVADIAKRGEEIRDRLQMLAHQSTGGRLIRTHGDYHLGQTLLDGDRWVIIDFEGEPARPNTERRRKRSPLRDVAGMMRSFAYVAAATEKERGKALADEWEATARRRFLDGYTTGADPILLPAGDTAVMKLLSIFELEKAVYELRYELNNRPDWVDIPVAGIRRLLDSQLG